MTRESVLELLWQMLRTSHDDSVTIRTPQGIAILQTNGKHLLVRVSDAEVVAGMSALAEALVAAQSRAVGALQKQYAAGKLEPEAFREKLATVGLTDDVDADRLIAALDLIREYGAALPSEPAPANGKAKDEPATDAQWALVKRLCGEKNQPVPDGPLSKVQAHECIDTLKAGTYDAGRWSVPF